MNFTSKNILFPNLFNINNDYTVIVAEVGVNHNSDLELAKKMADIAIESGADVVKYQAFKSEIEISRYAQKAHYQKVNTKDDKQGQLEMCKSLELSYSELGKIKNYCDDKRYPFLCTAFEEESLAFLVDDLKVKTVKIPSPEITNIPLLRKVGKTKVSVILSTGASNLFEVGRAVETLQKFGSKEIVLLHCVSQYPAPAEDINLRAIETMRKVFNLPVGLSDHSMGIEIPIAATALGACMIEKHFTLSRKMKGPDHAASLEPYELETMVKAIRNVNKALGDGIKKPTKSDLINLSVIRKGLVAEGLIKKGTVITEELIGIKRPLGGIEPFDFDKVIGRQAKHDLLPDKPIVWDDLV